MVDILVNTLADIIQVGIYKNSKLVKIYKSNQRASDFLISFFDEILLKENIKSIIYANGPGNYMGIKVAYLILRTISIIKQYKFYSVSGFELNNNSPIKANRNLCFVKEGEKIVLKKDFPKDFFLPKNLDDIKISKDVLPNYVLDPV